MNLDFNHLNTPDDFAMGMLCIAIVCIVLFAQLLFAIWKLRPKPPKPPRRPRRHKLRERLDKLRARLSHRLLSLMVAMHRRFLDSTRPALTPADVRTIVDESLIDAAWRDTKPRHADCVPIGIDEVDGSGIWRDELTGDTFNTGEPLTHDELASIR